MEAVSGAQVQLAVGLVDAWAAAEGSAVADRSRQRERAAAAAAFFAVISAEAAAALDREVKWA